MVLVSVCETIGVLTNLVLYLVRSEVVMADLMDSLLKVQFSIEI